MRHNNHDFANTFHLLFFFISFRSTNHAAASVANVQAAIEHIFPLVYEFRKKRAPTEPVPDPIAIVDEVDDAHDAMVDGDDGGVGGGKITKGGNSSKSKGVKRKYPFGMASNDPQEDNMIVSDDDEDDDL